eukprot:3353298-Prymnesium_polylepis.1
MELAVGHEPLGIHRERVLVVHRVLRVQRADRAVVPPEHVVRLLDVAEARAEAVGVLEHLRRQLLRECRTRRAHGVGDIRDLIGPDIPDAKRGGCDGNLQQSVNARRRRWRRRRHLRRSQWGWRADPH